MVLQAHLIRLAIVLVTCGWVPLVRNKELPGWSRLWHPSDSKGQSAFLMTLLSYYVTIPTAAGLHLDLSCACVDAACMCALCLSIRREIASYM